MSDGKWVPPPITIRICFKPHTAFCSRPACTAVFPWIKTSLLALLRGCGAAAGSAAAEDDDSFLSEHAPGAQVLASDRRSRELRISDK